MKLESTTVISALLGSFLGVALFALAAWVPMRSHHQGAVMGGGSMMGGSHSARSDADRRFLAMMVPHHEGAIAMADLALLQAEHSELKGLAEAIKNAQAKEIADMRAWHKNWYGEDIDDAGSSHGMMPGMGAMMGGDLAQLRTAKPFDREFIREMVPHHEMAIMMARMVENSSREEIRTLAKNIIRSQAEEIATMNAWSESWYPAQ